MNKNLTYVLVAVIVLLMAGAGYLFFSLNQQKQANQEMQELAELDKKEITRKESQPETFTVTIPAQDHNLFRDLIRRMGWACVF